MNTRLRCLLLDDELPGLAYLRTICEQLPEVEVVKAFNDPNLFLEEAGKYAFDICILDIEMPGMSGIEVARKINKPVIFTTAYKEHAAEAFDIDAIDYIRKPIEKSRFEKAVQKAIQHLAKEKTGKRFVQLNTNKGKSLIYFNQIAYITSSDIDKRDKCVCQKNGQQIILKNISFDQLNSDLPVKDFCRINKKDIVSLSSVKFYTHQDVTLGLSDSKELKLTLSENYKTEFLKKIVF